LADLTLRPTCRRALAMMIAIVASSCLGAVASANEIEEGEYLARAGDCISCHTAQDGAAYAGGLRLDTPFGYLLSPNITPDPETGIGHWTAEEFCRAMRDGVNIHNLDMYPVMPYTFYTKVTQKDCNAIYAYLRTLKPVRNAVNINHLRFPFDYRRTMGFWRELYFTAGTFKPDPRRTPSWNRGGYLVEGLGHCSACHSPRNALGGIKSNKQFTGATIDGWFALNLTSNLSTGLGDWTTEDIVSYLKTGSSKHKSTALGPMAEVVRNSLRYLTDADLSAMAEYLKSLPPNSSLRTEAPVPDPTRRRGALLYMDHCGGCHQAKGRGVPGVFPPLAGNDVVLAHDPANILKVVLGGIPARNGYIAMPSFARQLNDQQIAEIANYVRTGWNNSAMPNATAPMVAKLRGTTK
jgi:mono/diheme cytochrome c family protein